MRAKGQKERPTTHTCSTMMCSDAAVHKNAMAQLQDVFVAPT